MTESDLPVLILGDYMDRVYNNIFVSDISSVHEKSLSDYDINSVITVCQESTEDNVGCEYKHFNMSDGPDNKYGGRHDYEIFKESADYLYNKVASDKTVLIHCHKGQSRSVSVTVAVIGVLEGMNAQDSLSHIKSSRPQAEPDELLMEHAQKYINNNS